MGEAMSKNDEPATRPIEELEDTMLLAAYIKQFRDYLERECGCTCTALSGQSVRVRFPAGTMEEVEGTQMGGWREQQVYLPNGVVLRKRTYPKIQATNRVLVALLLPINWKKMKNHV